MRISKWLKNQDCTVSEPKISREGEEANMNIQFSRKLINTKPRRQYAEDRRNCI